MSQLIHILPEQLANKIAAGEVVQRPASVVKELVENSVDAGASSITIVIKEGGKSFVQVVDDGVGMSEEDASVAFGRHATSKISSYEDLENIRTLGFRGEALASIAAVAQVELRTRRREHDTATLVRIEGSEVKEVTKCAHEPGTSVVVRNLFYNTPGRRNFMKTNSTEFKHVVDVVQRLAISRPELHIAFVSDGDMVLEVKPSALDERIREVFGERQFENLVSFAAAGEVLSVHGYVSKPDFARKTRVEQFIFLNGRYIINRSLNHAVFQAYEHLLEKGSFPFFILYLQIDPQRVDVNVHPSKMEVKFEDERGIYHMVFTNVRRGLMERDIIPSLGSHGVGLDVTVGAHLPTEFSRPHPEDRRPVFPWQEMLIDQQTGEIVQRPASEETAVPGTGAGPTSDVPAEVSPPALVWQLHNKYIITPTREGLMVIDQHVAHERVLYERAVERFNGANRGSQQLLFPHTAELSPGDAALVEQLTPYLEELGFVLKFFGKTTVVVEGIPPDVRPGKESTILRELLDLYKENEHDVKLEPRENLAKSYACRAAIKAGDPLNEKEMRSLLAQLFETKVPYVCPHGRPVIIKLSLAELDRRFGRA